MKVKQATLLEETAGFLVGGFRSLFQGSEPSHEKARMPLRCDYNVLFDNVNWKAKKVILSLFLPLPAMNTSTVHMLYQHLPNRLNKCLFRKWFRQVAICSLAQSPILIQ